MTPTSLNNEPKTFSYKHSFSALKYSSHSILILHQCPLQGLVQLVSNFPVGCTVWERYKTNQKTSEKKLPIRTSDNGNEKKKTGLLIRTLGQNSSQGAIPVQNWGRQWTAEIFLQNQILLVYEFMTSLSSRPRTQSNKQDLRRGTVGRRWNLEAPQGRPNQGNMAVWCQSLPMPLLAEEGVILAV